MMEEDEQDYVSKTQLKRLAHEAKALGERLVDLPAKTLKQIDLPEEILQAVMQARDIKSHGARKRQLQFIGKLMRNIDTAPIAAELTRFDERHQSEVGEFHEVERWRDRLIEDSDDSLSQFIAAYPEVDIQQLRQLLRNTIQEVKAEKPPKYKRQLFQFLKQVLQSHE